MSKKAKKTQYNNGIDAIAYLIVNHSEALIKLLSIYDVNFKSKPDSKQLTSKLLLQLEKGDNAFKKDLELLIQKLSNQAEDGFIGGLLKGAVGLVGGLLSKKKKRRSNSNASNVALLAQQRQAAQAKRDLEMRRLRLEEERRRREAKEREERLRREAEQARKEEASKKRTNTILAVGAGIAVLGIGTMVFLGMRKPVMSYPNMQPANMPPV